MTTAEPHVLVLGSGSVGRRHMRNLSALGARISAMDPRTDRLFEAAAEVPLLGAYRTVEEALETTAANAVAVCSPPSYHVQQAIASLERGLPVLLEKPVSPRLDDAVRLAETVNRTGTSLVMGYTYRWWPALISMRDRLREGAVGKPLHVRCVMSAHLADWHPWENYQDFFMASAELGGGALLDESHFIDLMLWFFGMPSDVTASVERISALQIETDDNVDALLRYENGPRVSIHLDLFGRPHEKFIVVTGDRGTLQWSFDPNRLRLSHAADGGWQDEPFENERNDMFVEVGREFLEVIARAAEPSCTIQDGVDVLRVIEAMRSSSMQGRTVTMETVNSRR
jgi:predicted dehydrogenase